MKYLFQLYGNDTREQFERLTTDERQVLYADWMAVRKTPGVVPNDFELDVPTTATTVHVKDGQTLTTDGPFLETKEALGGYFLFEAEDIDAAIELAARVPTARRGGAVEIRPVVEH
jgi:hypothetical protein